MDNKNLTNRVREHALTLKALVLLIAALISVLALYQRNKSTLVELRNDFGAWLYNDEEWNGLFNNDPEGYVDLSSIDLSDTTLQLVLISRQGEIQGVIADKKFCKVGYPYGYKLIDGHVNLLGKSGNITVFDYEQGNRINYAEFSLRMNGIILETTPKPNSRWFGNATLTIAKDPNRTTDQAMEELYQFCKEEHDMLINRALSKKSGSKD